MKKCTIILLTVWVCILLGSCNKEGVYSPKNKISRIYIEETINCETYTPKHISEVWNWNGKLLESITHYNEDGTVWETENFQYDGKRLSVIKITGDDYAHYSFSYEKGKLSKISVNGADWRAEYKMTHKNGKISKITVSMWDYGKKGQNHIAKLPTAFKLFMSEPVCKAFDNQIKANTKKGYEDFYTDTYKYEWEGDNISKMTDSDGNYYKYTYDKKKNPFYGLFDMYNLDFRDMISKNNITTEIRDNGDRIDYMYEYEKNIPVKCTSEYIHIISHYYVRITKYYVYE